MTAQRIPQRVLVAAHPAGIRRLEKVLAGRELMKVQTLDEARQALERQQFCCMILGIQFDESRMLKLLEHVRSEERLHTPVVCVIGMKGRLSDAAIDAFDKAARALGAREVLDMTDFPDDDRGNGSLRQVIDRLMPDFKTPAGLAGGRELAG
jgi:CheY-like chemotaxis protein